MQLDGTQIEEGGNNMSFRKCSSVLLVLVLVMSMVIGGGLTVLLRLGREYRKVLSRARTMVKTRLEEQELVLVHCRQWAKRHGHIQKCRR